MRVHRYGATLMHFGISYLFIKNGFKNVAIERHTFTSWFQKRTPERLVSIIMHLISITVHLAHIRKYKSQFTMFYKHDAQ